MEELKSCPFCGSNALEIKFENSFSKPDSYQLYLYKAFVKCKSCSAKGGESLIVSSPSQEIDELSNMYLQQKRAEKAARAKWNTKQ